MLECAHCHQLRIPPECLIHDHVAPDPVGRIPLVMKILFGLRMLWLGGLIRGYRDREVKWLDVGCGDGQYLEYLQGRGYKFCVGIEPDVRRAQNARLRGLNVFASMEEAKSVTGINKFDLITLWHVVEHLPEPARVLQSYASFLADEGVMLFQVPNHESAQTGIFGRWSAFPDYGRHIWFHNGKVAEWTAEVLQPLTIRRLADFNFEYEIFAWVDTIASFVLRRPGFMLRTLKKGNSTKLEKGVGLALAVLILPSCSFLALVSLGFRCGSTLTLQASKPLSTKA